MAEKVRLTDDEVATIKKIILSFDREAKVVLFGSRAEVDKKGGDIDLLVISERIDNSTKRLIKAEFLTHLGDRKIDLVVTKKNGLDKPFVKLALKKGVEI
ncbi:MAG: nucleotidyltransferase domain-containing protein [Nitrospirae bacterium]|nr:MAG: nucleotidyltransferase domain-containing protein [Nitrospirota bacterium]